MPLRVRLALVVAAAVAVLFTGVGVVVLHQLQTGLDSAVDTTLRARVDVLSAQVASLSGAGFQDAGAAGLLPPNEALAQLISNNSTVLDSSEGAKRALLFSRTPSSGSGGRTLLALMDRKARDWVCPSWTPLSTNMAGR